MARYGDTCGDDDSSTLVQGQQSDEGIIIVYYIHSFWLILTFWHAKKIAVVKVEEMVVVDQAEKREMMPVKMTKVHVAT